MADKKTKSKGKKSGVPAFQDQEVSDQEKAGVKGGGIVINDNTTLGSPTLNPASPNRVNYTINGFK